MAARNKGLFIVRPGYSPSDTNMAVTPSRIVGSLRGRPGTTFVAFLGVIFLVDLLLKLAVIEVGPLGGRLTFTRLGGGISRGIVIGLIIGLAGIGLSMTYSILNFANVSHGDLITVGAFSGWGVAYIILGWSFVAADPDVGIGRLFLIRTPGDVGFTELGASVLLSPGAIFVGLFAAAAFTALIALGVDRIVYKPMRDRSGISLLIVSIGVALILRYAIWFIYGTRERPVVSSQQTLYVFLPTGSVPINTHTGTIVVAGVLLMLGTHYLLQHTKLGTAMRAMSDNKDLAMVTGIPTERTITWTWLIGGSLAGAAGYLYILIRTLNFDVGWLLLLLIFAAVILGGIGSIYGAIAGGLVIGLVFQLSPIWLGSDFNYVAAYMAMILVLLLRPEGIFKGVSTA